MPDREKVIKGLECCVKESEGYEEQCGECLYGAKGGGCIDRLLADTITLLKEQESKWVEDKQDDVCRLIKCQNCGLTFIVGNNVPYDEWIEDKTYCRRCGARMVKQQ